MVLPTIWGPPMWQMLFSCTWNCSTANFEKLYALVFVHLPHILPCAKCKDHFGRNVAKVDERAKGRPTDPSSMFLWLWFLKDEVNLSLGQQTIPFDEIYKRYCVHNGAMINAVHLADVLVIVALDLEDQEDGLAMGTVGISKTGRDGGINGLVTVSRMSTQGSTIKSMSNSLGSRTLRSGTQLGTSRSVFPQNRPPLLLRNELGVGSGDCVLTATTPKDHFWSMCQILHEILPLPAGPTSFRMALKFVTPFCPSTTALLAARAARADFGLDMQYLDHYKGFLNDS